MYFCKFCQKVYTTLKSLEKHERGHENHPTMSSTEQPARTKKLFKCTFCKSVFHTKEEYSNHQHTEHANLLSEYLIENTVAYNRI